MGKRETLAEKKLKYEGKTLPTNCDGDVLVLEYKDSRNVVIEFINTGYIKTITAGQLMSKEIKDNSLSSLHGIKLVTSQNAWKDHNKTYRLWIALHERCYSEKHHILNPTYKDCSTSENFKNFNYFKEWCNKQIGFNQEGWHLDKDILFKGNKLYSEETCVFIPHEVNTLILTSSGIRGKHPIGVTRKANNGRYRARISKCGKYESLGTYDTKEEAFLAYKKAKETYIKEVANKWKDKIDIRVYNALMLWEVEITD